MKATTKKVVKITAILTIIAVGIGGAALVLAGPHFSMKGGGHHGRFGGMGRGGAFDSDTMMPLITEHLKLTDEQEAQVKPILEAHIEKQRELFGQSRGKAKDGLQDIQQQHEQLWQELEGQLAGVLTEEQMQQVRTFHEQHQQHRRGMFEAHGEFRQLMTDLDLSAAQKAKFLTIFMKYRGDHQEAVDTMMETSSEVVTMVLNEEFDEQKVRQTYRDTTAKFEDFVVTRANMLAEMKAVLNADQLKLLQDKAPEFLAKAQERMQTRHSMMNKWFPNK